MKPASKRKMGAASIMGRRKSKAASEKSNGSERSEDDPANGDAKTDNPFAKKFMLRGKGGGNAGAADMSNALKNLAIASSGDDDSDDSSEEDLETEELMKWRKRRWDRDELYSKRYRPVAAEKKETKELNVLVGLESGSSGDAISDVGQELVAFTDNIIQTINPFSLVAAFDSDPNSETKVKQRMDNLQSKHTPSWKAMLHPEEGEHISVVMQRGPIASVCALDGNSLTECEMILLTKGLVIIRKKTLTTSPRPGGCGTFSIVTAVTWEEVEWVGASIVDTNGDVIKDPPENVECKFRIQLKAGALKNGSNGDSSRQVVVTCNNERQHQFWLKAIEYVMVKHHDTGIIDLGWQYRYSLKLGFSLAVMDEGDQAGPPPIGTPKPKVTRKYAFAINLLDVYNGYTALHYAVKLKHVSAIRRLLDLGANPEKKSRDGDNPLEVGVREGLLSNSVLELMQSYSKSAGKKSVKGALAQIKQQQQTSSLFGNVAQLAMDKAAEDRARKKQEDEAKKAQSAMSENMKLLQKRGEQINHLSDKATELNKGAEDYANMAKQLKEKSKKQAKWW